LCLALIVCFSFIVPTKNEKWVLTSGCTLKVDGSTNINKFTCDISDYSSPDTISQFNYDNAHKLFPLKGVLNIEVNAFNCHNPLMTSDLRKTLKAKEYPRLKINFISLKELPDNKKINQKTTGLVDIELSGVVKRFEVEYTFKSDEPGLVIATGLRQVTFTDFNLVPPRKLGGMIRTNDALLISFHLRMKTI